MKFDVVDTIFIYKFIFSDLYTDRGCFTFKHDLENKMMDLMEDLAGYMGEAAAAGMTLGSTPMLIMAGTAKGIYKKITD